MDRLEKKDAFLKQLQLELYKDKQEALQDMRLPELSQNLVAPCVLSFIAVLDLNHIYWHVLTNSGKPPLWCDKSSCWRQLL